jgi:hypothetical protein
MSTVRAIVNKKRVATAKPWGTKFLQVYPEQKTFPSEGEWKKHVVSTLLDSVEFEKEEEKQEKEEQSKEDQNWICNYCDLGPGNDHRLCICDGYKYNVKDWENDRRFPKKSKATAPAPAPIVSNPIMGEGWGFNRKHQATLPPGEYYIGDLCYALNDYLYDKVFGPRYETGYFSRLDAPDYVFMIGGHFDDGTFRGSDRKRFEVDSGTIGIASIATLALEKAPYSGGHLYSFKTPVHVDVAGDNFKFYGEHYTDPHLKIYIYGDECDSDF